MAHLTAAEMSKLVGGDPRGRCQAIVLPGQTVVTDGHFAVVYPEEIDISEFSFYGYPITEESMRTMLKRLPDMGPAQPIDRTRLREWATVPPAPECGRCNGAGEIECAECDSRGTLDCRCSDCGDEHEVDCRDCRGEGGATCGCGADRAKACLGKVGSLGVNRDLVAAVLDLLPPGDARHLIAPLGDTGPFRAAIHIEAAGARAVLIEMDGVTDDVPKFDPAGEAVR